MRALSDEEIWTFLGDEPIAKRRQRDVLSHEGTRVKNYLDLAEKIAALHFYNPNYVLLLRGQNKDYRLGRQEVPADQKDNPPSTIRPSIFRKSERHKPEDWHNLILKRYQKLKEAENLLVRFDKLFNYRPGEAQRRLLRSGVIRWAILQHYEVCDTPLLDVTHSLRIAASIASLNNTSNEVFVMVLAAPQISGSVSVCAFHEMQILRLSSLCPPTAMRPHLQEGYLLGEYPELHSYDEKRTIHLHETDFAQRLIAKFRFNPKTFWEEKHFPKFSDKALSLSDTHDEDMLLPITQEIHRQLKLEFPD